MVSMHVVKSPLETNTVSVVVPMLVNGWHAECVDVVSHKNAAISCMDSLDYRSVLGTDVQTVPSDHQVHTGFPIMTVL